MKTETKLTLLIILIVIGIALMIWGNIIMRNYNDYLGIMKLARHAALPQFISGLVILIGAYLLTYKKTK